MTNAEIDRLVAEKVMGWKLWLERRGEYTYVVAQKDYREPWKSSRSEYWEEHKKRYEPLGDARINPKKHIAAFLDSFKPSTSISDAWAVVEKFQVGAVEIARGFDCWSCEFTGPAGNGKALAKTIELAICLAALRALGVEVPQ